MTKTTRPARAVDDVLYEFAIAKERPDAGLLDDFVRRYPEHATALTSFAVSLALDALSDNKDAPTELPREATDALSRAMSRFQNRLHATKTGAQSRSAASSAQNPFALLTKEEIRSFTARLHANRVFVMKLRDRDIDSDSMTDGFKQRVADELNAPLDLVVAHFAASSKIQPETRFKSETKPQTGTKQPFEDAVRNCGLTPEQQAYLFAL